MPMLPHGGRLRAAAARYAIALPEWLDLSTGINPQGWPVPPPPAWTWSRLPEDDDELVSVACRYYGTRHVLPVSGSQAAIQALPQLRPPCRVSVIQPGYNEHAHAWRRAGHTVTSVAVPALDHAVKISDVVVLIHPNNPTGTAFPPQQLLDWRRTLAARGGWLIVDEAFMDATPAQSLTPHCPEPGLIILRSLGKFFGLAGARVGFVCAEPSLLQRLQAQLGPWTVATPARWVASQALADHRWHADTRRQLQTASKRLIDVLQHHGYTPQGGCALFQWVPTPHAAALHEALARRAILTRVFDEPASLRFGLPQGEAHWSRLDAALAATTTADAQS